MQDFENCQGIDLSAVCHNWRKPEQQTVRVEKSNGDLSAERAISGQGVLVTVLSVEFTVAYPLALQGETARYSPPIACQ
jgi:hypothetical protein